MLPVSHPHFSNYQSFYKARIIVFQNNSLLCTLFKKMLILHGSKLQLCADFEEFVRLQNFFIGYFACLKIFFSFSPSTNKMIYDILGRILRIQSQTTFESSIRIMNWTFDFYWMKISNHHSHNSTFFSIPKISYFRKL